MTTTRQRANADVDVDVDANVDTEVDVDVPTCRRVNVDIDDHVNVVEIPRDWWPDSWFVDRAARTQPRFHRPAVPLRMCGLGRQLSAEQWTAVATLWTLLGEWAAEVGAIAYETYGRLGRSGVDASEKLAEPM